MLISRSAFTTPFQNTSSEEKKPKAQVVLNGDGDEIVVIGVDDRTHVLSPIACSVASAMYPNKYRR